MKILIKRFEEKHKKFCTQIIKTKQILYIKQFYLDKIYEHLKSKNSKKKEIILYIILAAKKINSYQIELQNLQYLKKLTLYFSINTSSIETKEQDIFIRIDDLKRTISNRFHYLLNIEGKKTFCEASYDSEKNKWEIIKNSITSYPITQLGSKDLRRGLVPLTGVRLKKVKTSKYLSKKNIVLTDYILDLYSGELYKTNN